MTQVQVNWLSLLLSPIVIVTLVLAFSARRSATKKGEPMPGWGKVTQVVGVTLAMFVALINMVWGAA